MIYRVGTQDDDVLREVLMENCYSLPNDLPADELIIDIGAHIGCFALACLRRGARKIVCFEPDPENFDLLRQNLEPYSEYVTIHNKAVFKKGVSRARMLRGTEKTEIITAVAIVHEQDTDDGFVDCVDLESIIAEHGEAGILKLDCEGGEWPSFAETDNLDKVKQIIAEIHLKCIVPGYRCNLPGAYRVLRQKGFDVLLTPGKEPEFIYNLFAWREK